MSGTLTTANSAILLAVDTVFPNAQQLVGYAAEDIFDTEDVDLAETSMGLDAILSGGWIPYSLKQTFTLQANSPSFLFFNTWIAAQNAVRDLFRVQGTELLPGIGIKWAMANGILKRAKVIPDAKKNLQPVTYQIEWESATPTPI